MSGHPSDFDPQFATPEERDRDLARREDRQRTREKFIGRSANLNWCTCGECVLQPKDRENYCCTESDLICTLKDNEKCVTLKPTFHRYVTDAEELNILRNQLVISGHGVYEDESNRMWRYLSYTRFVSWVRARAAFGERRVPRWVLPSCVVKEIRKKYPEDDGLYVGHKVKFGEEPHYPA